MPAGRRPCFMAPEATWSGISGFRLRYESCRAKERGAGVAIRILSLPAGDSGERSIPRPGLTVCPRGYRRRRAVDCRGPAGPWRGRFTMRISGRREDRRSYARAGPCLCGGLHPASSSDRTKVRGRGPPPGAGAEEEPATCCRQNPQGSTRWSWWPNTATPACADAREGTKMTARRRPKRCVTD